MKILAYALLILSAPSVVCAQHIAILDRGLNEDETNRALGDNRFGSNNSLNNRVVAQRCFSLQDERLTVMGEEISDFLPQPIDITNSLSITYDPTFGVSPGQPPSPEVDIYRQLSLCANGESSDRSQRAAMLPRILTTRDVEDSYIGTDRLRGNEIRHDIGDELIHGSGTSNAAWDMSSDVRQTIYQVFGIGVSVRRTRTVARDGDDLEVVLDSNTAGQNLGAILEALNDIANNPGTISVVNLSFQSTVALPELQPNNIVPSSCSDSLGQLAINALNARNIAVTTGLLNRDVRNGEVTWPSCLDGVIKVGAESFNDVFTNGGLGIGANGIDFYGVDTVPEQPTLLGSSFAAPRIAAALAELAAHRPSSTIQQRVDALKTTASRSRTYEVNGNTWTRSFFREQDLDNAKTALGIFIDSGNDFPASDPEAQVIAGEIDFSRDLLGPRFGRPNVDLEFSIRLGNNLSGVASSITSSTSMITPLILTNVPNGFTSPFSSRSLSGFRDIAVDFIASYEGVSTAGFQLVVNRVEVNRLRELLTNGQERDISFVIERDTFSRGLFNNQTSTLDLRLDISALSSLGDWGIRDLTAGYLPIVPLEVGEVDTNMYGSNEASTRFTGMRASFNIDQNDGGRILSMTGWGINVIDETSVFVNGEFLGYVSTGSVNGFSPNTEFIMPQSILNEGNNFIELVQRRIGGGWGTSALDGRPINIDREWGVTNLLVSEVSKDLAIQSVSLNGRASTESISLATVVSNVGSTFVDRVRLEYYLSEDNVITRSDIRIGARNTPSLAARQSRMLNSDLQSSFIRDELYFGACVVAVDGEDNVSNNCLLGGQLDIGFNVLPALFLLLLGDDE